MAVIAIQKNYATVCTMSSGATLSAAVDLQAVYGRVYLDCPSLPSGSLFVHGSSDNSTFRRIYGADPNQGDPWTLTSPVVQNGGLFQIPPGFQYYKVENSSGVTQAIKTFSFIGVMNK